MVYSGSCWNRGLWRRGSGPDETKCEDVRHIPGSRIYLVETVSYWFLLLHVCISGVWWQWIYFRKINYVKVLILSHGIKWAAEWEFRCFEVHYLQRWFKTNIMLTLRRGVIKWKIRGLLTNSILSANDPWWNQTCREMTDQETGGLYIF